MNNNFNLKIYDQAKKNAQNRLIKGIKFILDTIL